LSGKKSQKCRAAKVVVFFVRNKNISKFLAENIDISRRLGLHHASRTHLRFMNVNMQEQYVYIETNTIANRFGSDYSILDENQQLATL
jgi:hypothetical protein